MKKERGILAIWLMFVLLLGVIIGIGFNYLSNAGVTETKEELANTAYREEEPKPEDIYKNVLPSIMTLDIETKDGRTVSRIAFLASKEGMAVTAWQVIKNARRVVARFSNGEEFDSSGLVDKDTKRNLALIRIKVFGRPMLVCDPAEPVAGSKAYFLVAKDSCFSISETTVEQIQVSDGAKVYYLSSPALPESTGGPFVEHQR